MGRKKGIAHDDLPLFNVEKRMYTRGVQFFSSFATALLRDASGRSHERWRQETVQYARDEQVQIGMRTGNCSGMESLCLLSVWAASPLVTVRRMGSSQMFNRPNVAVLLLVLATSLSPKRG